MVGKKLKLGGKGHGENAEEGGVYKCNKGRDFSHLALVGGEEGEYMWWESSLAMAEESGENA